MATFEPKPALTERFFGILILARRFEQSTVSTRGEVGLAAAVRPLPRALSLSIQGTDTGRRAMPYSPLASTVAECLEDRK